MGQSVWGLLWSRSSVSTSRIDWLLSKRVKWQLLGVTCLLLLHSNMHCLYSLVPWETCISQEGYMRKEKRQQTNLLVVAELWVKYLEFCCWSYVKVAQYMPDSFSPHGLYCPWNSPGQYTRVGSCSLLQRIFPTQGLNTGLQHCRRILFFFSLRRMCLFTWLLQGLVVA